MLIALSSIEFDPEGSGLLRVRPASINESRGGGRRQTKTATLDGGVSLYDTGYTLTDQTWRIRCEGSPEAERLVSHLSRNYPRIRVVTDTHHVEASIESWRMDGQDIIIVLSVLGEL